MRNKLGPGFSRSSTRHTLHRLLTQARFEVLPSDTIQDKVAAALPAGTTVTVTASPAKGLEATLQLSESLASAGYDVVPHLAARMVHGPGELAEIAGRLHAVGVQKIFVPGGDAQVEDTYPDALSLLEDLAKLPVAFEHIGIAGYPESHPTIDDDITIQAMWDKRKYATHVVSNMTFDPNLIKSWVIRMRRRGITLPLLVGLPGPIDRTKLLTMATKIGIGESTRFLVKQKGVLARLAAPGGFTGERFLRQCAPTLGEASALCAGVHLYTFNQVAETEQWRQRLLAESSE